VLGADDPAVGPTSAILLRTESASSSQIDYRTTSARQLAMVELHQAHKPNALTVVGNVRAKEAAMRLSVHIEEAGDPHGELATGGQQRAGPHPGRLCSVPSYWYSSR
jgi:hypothetical protein